MKVKNVRRLASLTFYRAARSYIKPQYPPVTVKAAPFLRFAKVLCSRRLDLDGAKDEGCTTEYRIVLADLPD